MTEWQPIETAPKDGTAIDLWAAERERYESSRIADCWRLDGEWVHCRTIYDDADDSLPEWSPLFNVTHWMPLPDPPAEGA